MAAPHPLLLMHPWKSGVETSRVHLSQVLAWWILPSSYLPPECHYGFMASCPALLLAEAWESGVTFQ